MPSASSSIYSSASFFSSLLDLQDFLLSRGVATSRTTAFNPKGNGQVERLNGTLWKSIALILKSEGLPTSQWEKVLPNALHAIRSLLCTATNETPHERFFLFNRKSATGTTLPSWLSSPGLVLMRRNVRSSKYDPLVDEVELLDCNPMFVYRMDARPLCLFISLPLLASVMIQIKQSPLSLLTP